MTSLTANLHLVSFRKVPSSNVRDSSQLVIVYANAAVLPARNVHHSLVSVWPAIRQAHLNLDWTDDVRVRLLES